MQRHSRPTPPSNPSSECFLLPQPCLYAHLSFLAASATTALVPGEGGPLQRRSRPTPPSHPSSECSLLPPFLACVLTCPPLQSPQQRPWCRGRKGPCRGAQDQHHPHNPRVSVLSFHPSLACVLTCPSLQSLEQQPWYRGREGPCRGTQDQHHPHIPQVSVASSHPPLLCAHLASLAVSTTTALVLREGGPLQRCSRPTPPSHPSGDRFLTPSLAGLCAHCVLSCPSLQPRGQRPWC